VGGVVGAALLTALILWYRRRRRLHARPEPSPFAEKEEVFGFSDPSASMSTGKYYVRAIAPGTRLFISLCDCFDELCRVIFRIHPTRVRSRNRSYHHRRVCSKPLQVPIKSIAVGRFVRQTGPGIPVCRLFDLMISSQSCQSSCLFRQFDTRHGQ
jgi:hypothetical protein